MRIVAENYKSSGVGLSRTDDSLVYIHKQSWWSLGVPLVATPRWRVSPKHQPLTKLLQMVWPTPPYFVLQFADNIINFTVIFDNHVHTLCLRFNNKSVASYTLYHIF